MIAFARYLPLTLALPVTSETCPFPLDYSTQHCHSRARTAWPCWSSTTRCSPGPGTSSGTTWTAPTCRTTSARTCATWQRGQLEKIKIYTYTKWIEIINLTWKQLKLIAGGENTEIMWEGKRPEHLFRLSLLSMHRCETSLLQNSSRDGVHRHNNSNFTVHFRFFSVFFYYTYYTTCYLALRGNFMVSHRRSKL